LSNVWKMKVLRFGQFNLGLPIYGMEERSNSTGFSLEKADLVSYEFS